MGHVEIGRIVSGENHELDAGSVKIRVSSGRFQLLTKAGSDFDFVLGELPGSRYRNYGVSVAGEDMSEEEFAGIAIKETLNWQSKVLDLYLKKVLTPHQYRIFSRANESGKTVKFVKAVR